MKKRYQVVVYGKRGNQPAYRYTQVKSCKPSKVDRLLAETAWDVASHESRSGYPASVVEHAGGWVVRVGYCKFVVRALPVAGEHV